MLISLLLCTALQTPCSSNTTDDSNKLVLPTPETTIAFRNSNDVVVTPANGVLCSNPASFPDDPDCIRDPSSLLGAEISGIRDFSTLTDAQIGEIRSALNKYKVVYFKGAAPLLTPAIQLSFAERFGDVLREVSNVPKYVEKGVHQSAHSAQDWSKVNSTTAVFKSALRPDTPQPQNTNAVASMVEANKEGSKNWRGVAMPDRVTRLVRERGDPFAFGEGLHADVTFFRKPPVYTFLVARELPGGQDDTHFVDASRAWRELPVDVRERTAGLSAVHNDSAGMHTTHPFARTHPATDEQALYVNSHFTHSVVGYGEEEGRALLADVFAHVEAQPRFRFKWSCDSTSGATTTTSSGSISCDKHPGPYTTNQCSECLHVLMWDNRALQHSSTTEWAANATLNKRRRELHRITISDSAGERPFYRP